MPPKRSTRRSGSISVSLNRTSSVSHSLSRSIYISSGVNSSTSSNSQASQRSSTNTPSHEDSQDLSRRPPRQIRSSAPFPPIRTHTAQNLPHDLFDASARVGTGHGRAYFDLDEHYNRLGEGEPFFENANLQLSDEDSGADSEIAEEEAIRGLRYGNGNDWLEYGMGRALGNVDTDVSEKEDLGIEGLEVGESASEDQEREVEIEVVRFTVNGDWKKVKQKEMALSLRDFVVPDSASDSELEMMFGGSQRRERVDLGRRAAARKRRKVIESNNERRNWKNVYVVLDSDDEPPRKRRKTPQGKLPTDSSSTDYSSSDGYQADTERVDASASSSRHSPARSPARSPPADPSSNSSSSSSDGDHDDNVDYQMSRVKDAINYTAERLSANDNAEFTTRVRIPYSRSDVLTLLHHAVEAGLARLNARHAHYEAYVIEKRPLTERDDDDQMVRIQDAIDYTAEVLEAGNAIEVTTRIRISYDRPAILSMLRDAAEARLIQFVMANAEYEAYEIGLRPRADSNADGYTWNVQSNEPRGTGQEEKKFGPPSEWPTRYPESEDEDNEIDGSERSQSQTPIGIQRARRERATQQAALEEENELVEQQRDRSDDANYIGKDPHWWLNRQTGKPKSMANLIIGPDDNDQMDRRHESYSALQQEARDELKEMREQRKIAMKLRIVKVDPRAGQGEGGEEVEVEREREGFSEQEKEDEIDEKTVSEDNIEEVPTVVDDEANKTYLDIEDEDYEEVDNDHTSAESYED